MTKNSLGFLSLKNCLQKIQLEKNDNNYYKHM